MTHKRIPRARRGGSSDADAPGEIGAAGRELHSIAGEGVPGDRTRQAGAGGKLRNTVFSLRRGNPVRGGTPQAL